LEAVLNQSFATNEEVILAARRNLAQGPWDYLMGAAESETTMRRNREGFDRLAFRPRVGIDVSKVDPSASFLGYNLRIPVLLSPIGGVQAFSPGGAADSAQAASDFGIIPVISSSTEPELEETAKAGDGPKMYQLYVDGDDGWIRDMLDRVVAAGYKALAVTVDSAHYSKRERPLISRWVPPGRRPTTVRDTNYRKSITWELIEKIKGMTDLPFMLKGIATAEDTKIAVDLGVQVIWVSNHGGRQLDHGRGSIEVVPEVVEAAAGKADVIVDGGVNRGTDIIKAFALGVKAVGLGRLHGWGLAAGGPAALVRTLQILEEELVVSMGLLGVRNLAEITPNHVCKVDPVAPAHEMSAWPNLPGTRLL
jgi:glycolate oxidase